MTKWKGNDRVLAENPRSGKLVLGPDERSMHLHAVGATGAGKSRYLEYLARQDIKNWRHSECGMLLLDPHGFLWERLILNG